MSEEKKKWLENRNKKDYGKVFAQEGVSGYARSSTTVTQYGWEDRDFFASDEEIPTDPIQIISACMQAYDRFGIVRNLIDMMSDFAIKGLDVVNKSKRAQKIGREWIKKIDGTCLAERIAHMLFLCSTVPVYRKIGVLPKEMEARSKKEPGNPLSKGEIPIEYSVLDPRLIDAPTVVDGTKPTSWTQNSYKISTERGQTKKVNFFGPIVQDRGSSLLSHQMTERHYSLLFYKKYDFTAIPTPMLYPVFRNLQMLDKLQLADISVLDGATSKIYLWKLGNTEREIFPTEEAFDRLESMLSLNNGSGVRHVLWDDNISMQENSNDFYKILTDEKLQSTVQQILQGFGVPGSMVGSVEKQGYSNNFASLRTLVERLNYARKIIKLFLEKELSIVQQAYGINSPFIVVFDHSSLSDEAQEKKLLIELVDRNILSEELIIERFGADPEVELYRTRLENRQRDRGYRAAKSGQFHKDSMLSYDIKKALVEMGVVSPEQMAIRLKPIGDSTPLNELLPDDIDIEDEEESPQDKKSPSVSIQEKGRKRGAKDVVKRKTKRPALASNLGELISHFSSYRQELDKNVQAMFLEVLGKSNLRQLTDEEGEQVEGLCFLLLCSASLEQRPTKEYIKELCSQNLTIPAKVSSLYERCLSSLENPTLEQQRQLRVYAVSVVKSGVSIN